MPPRIAGDKAYGITISNNARIVRNLLEGAQFLHSHILWLYNLAALDYVNPLNALQANVDDAYAVALENGLALHSDLNQLYEKLAAFADNGQLSIFSGNWFRRRRRRGLRRQPGGEPDPHLPLPGGSRRCRPAPPRWRRCSAARCPTS